MSEFIKSQLSTMEIKISEKQLGQFEGMLDLLAIWNEKHNLTRLKDRREQEIYHILDALSAYKYFEDSTVILDVGTGAGFPGIPLAIMYPEKHFHLVDSNGKKTAYLKQLSKHIGLTNVSIHHARVETLDINNIDCITARAVADPQVIMSITEKFKVSTYLLYVGPNCPKVVNSTLDKLVVPCSNKQHYLLKIDMLYG